MKRLRLGIFSKVLSKMTVMELMSLQRCIVLPSLFLQCFDFVIFATLYGKCCQAYAHDSSGGCVPQSRQTTVQEIEFCLCRALGKRMFHYVSHGMRPAEPQPYLGLLYVHDHGAQEELLAYVQQRGILKPCPSQDSMAHGVQ